MLVLFTDFGAEGPYLGQVRAVLHRDAPGVPVVDLFADLPPFDPRAAAYLLAAYAVPPFALGSVFLAVVDPGVGSDRPAVIVNADGYWFVGPDNGLFEMVIRRAKRVRFWHFSWDPNQVSASFHGRDVFAPAAAALARGGRPGDDDDRAGGFLSRAEERQPGHRHLVDWPDDIAEVVYLDRFGNAMIGVRANMFPPAATVTVRDTVQGGERVLGPARTFSEVPRGTPFWYANANGLIEIAVNGGSASADLGLRVGDAVNLRES